MSPWTRKWDFGGKAIWSKGNNAASLLAAPHGLVRLYLRGLSHPVVNRCGHACHEHDGDGRVELGVVLNSRVMDGDVTRELGRYRIAVLLEP